jgi:transglutaminase-like putative cysteine protease
MPVFKIQHTTKYEYDRLIQESMNEVKIFPASSAEQEVLQQELQISANPEVEHFIDYWGNNTGVFNLLAPHSEMVIKNNLKIRTSDNPELKINFISVFNDLAGEVNNRLKILELSNPEFVQSQRMIDEITRLVYSPDDSVALTIKNCSDYIFSNFSYIKGITNTETTVDEILEKKAGVCQDFAHIMLQILRCMKVPCRYVSGYICPNRPGLRGEGATHAWVEAWVPHSGWTGIDPTNNIWATNTHVKLAVGRNFADCTPVKGTFKGPANQQLSVSVSVDYEDGHIIKELNEVDMKTKKLPGVSPHFSPAAQQ